MSESGWAWTAAELRAATDFADDSIAIFDPKHRHLFVNRMAAAAFGLKPEEIVGRTQEELGFDADFRAEWDLMLRQAAATGEAQTREYEAHMPGGTRWLRTHIAPVRGPNGQVRALVASTKDLTEQRRSEALRENQLEIMRQIESGESLAALMASIASLAQARVPGRACAVLLRQAGGQFAGSPELSIELLAAISPILWAEHPGRASESAAEPRSVTWANIGHEPRWQPVRRELQQLGWQSAWTHPIRGRDGRMLGAVLMLHRRARAAKSWEASVLAESAASAELAIEHRLTQDSLLEAQARYRAMFDQTLHLICVTDIHGKILELNNAAQPLLGYAPADEIGKSVFDQIHPEDRKRVAKVFRPLAKKDGESASTIYRVKHSDGSWRVFEAVARSLHNIRGRRIILLTARDVTDRIRVTDELRASKARLQRALEATGLGMWEWDVATGKITSDQRYQEILGYAPGTMPLTAENRAAHVHPDDQAATASAVQAHLRGDTPFFEIKHRAKTASGDWKWLVARGQVVQRDPSGAPLRVTGTVRDVDAEEQTRHSLDRVTRRVQLLLEASDEGIMGLDREGRCTFANEAAARLLGYSINQMLGKHFQELAQHEFDGGIDQKWEETAVYRCLTEHSRQRSVPDMLWHSAWRRFPVEYGVSPILSDEEGGGAVLIFRDGSEKRALAKQLRHQALHDPLTGLVNRRGFEAKLDELIASAKRDHRTHALGFMDLDQFKLINDTCGHSAGDELLRQLPRQLQAVVRSQDLLARLGGDEFGVLLPNVNLEEASKIAGALRDTVRDFRFSWGGKTFSVGVSVGVVAITHETASVTAALSAADAASYVAKNAGPNQVHVSQPDDQAVQMRRGEVGWVGRLRAALDEDHFRLYFQSIGALATDPPALQHHEVLLRLRNEAGELVSPGQFLAVAERYQLMAAIDGWVIDRTLKMLGRQLITHPGLAKHCLGINLSGDSIRGQQLAEKIRQSLAKYRVPPKMVYFEITETAAISDMQAAVAFMNELKQIGCRLALDDFGSGMSSFTYLKNLPVDFLKIDGSFIRDMEKSSLDQSIVRAIHSVGRNMGIKTVAEYVETQNLLKRLREIGIDYAQGYAVAKPLPLEDLPDLIDAEPAVRATAT
ncbi:MAG TPA: EAL domain-containing protein [Nevskiaceae bacterium]|nr:EAL domain-containing protein [Nevskiaceae bacterium]